MCNKLMFDLTKKTSDSANWNQNEVELWRSKGGGD